MGTMTGSGVVGGLLLLVTTVAACGTSPAGGMSATGAAGHGGAIPGVGSAAGATGGSGAGGVSSGPMQPGPPATAGDPHGPPAVIRPGVVSPEPAVQLRRQRFISVVPAPAGAELLVSTVLTGLPQCAVLGRVDVAESATSVRVTLWVGHQPGADCGGPQPQLAREVVTRVRLAAPLGGRTVHDGAA